MHEIIPEELVDGLRNQSRIAIINCTVLTRQITLLRLRYEAQVDVSHVLTSAVLGLEVSLRTNFESLALVVTSLLPTLQSR